MHEYNILIKEKNAGKKKKIIWPYCVQECAMQTHTHKFWCNNVDVKNTVLQYNIHETLKVIAIYAHVGGTWIEKL